MKTTFLEYSDSEHRYFADGRERMSVTTILDAAGTISPFCKNEEARARGSKVHEICHIDDVNRLDLRSVPIDLRGYLKAWRQYRKDTGFTPTLIEHRVDCTVPGYEYSGRFDRLGTLPGKLNAVLLDIKTAKTGAIADYPRLQLAAYAYALDEKKVFERVTVSLRPDGRYNTKTYDAWRYYTDRAEWLILVKQVQEKD